MNLDIKETLDLLNFYLKKQGHKKSFVICGGAALILQGIARGGRVTKDVDVVAPDIDQALRDASVQVAHDLGISAKWLNTDAQSLTTDLSAGWEKRTNAVYRASNLEVFSISREDMIFAKFWAYCDRQQDLSDLVDLKVTEAEIDLAADLTSTKDTNPSWPEYVKEQTQKLKVKMRYV